MKKLLSLALTVAFLLSCFVGCAGNPDTPDNPTDTTTEGSGDVTPVSGPHYAADDLFDGSKITDTDGEITVGIIGSGNFIGQVQYDIYENPYGPNDLYDSFIYTVSSCFPSKTVRFYNAYTSGTESNFGAAFAVDKLLQYEPDIVFIDFTQQNSYLTADEIKEGMNGIISAAKGMAKIPVIAVLQMVPLYADDDENFAVYRAAMDAEREVAEANGIAVIDLHAALIDVYNAMSISDFNLFKNALFSGNSAIPENHEGVKIFMTAVEKAITENPASFFTKLSEDNTEVHEILYPDSEKITYEGEWNSYNLDNPFESDGSILAEFLKIDENRMRYPDLRYGYTETLGTGSISFETKAGSFAIETIPSKRGNIAKIYCDGEYLTAVNLNTGDIKKGLDDEALYTSAGKFLQGFEKNGTLVVTLPNDGNTHKIEIKAEEPDDSHVSFRFAGIETVTDSAYAEERNYQPKVIKKYEKAEGKTYAADTLLDANGDFASDSEGSLKIAFIGGSLTYLANGLVYSDNEGNSFLGNPWIADIMEYITSKYPKRDISVVNAAVGGIGSVYGSERFKQTVLDFEPDLIFVEFDCNDSGLEEAPGHYYIEQMFQMAAECEKEPVIIYLHMPLPYDLDDELNKRREEQATYKQEVADAYGIGTVNIYNYIRRAFDESGSDDFIKFLEPYYPAFTLDAYDVHPGVYDVHGGFEFYAPAIIERLENEGASSLIHRMTIPEKSFGDGLYADYADRRYVRHSSTDEALEYTGTWNHYDHSNMWEYPTVEGDYINYQTVSYPSGTDGVGMTRELGASVSLKTTAAEITLVFPTALGGGSASIYVDGEKVSSVATRSAANTGLVYVVKTPIPEDGNEHTYSVVSDEDGKSFLFYYITESVHSGTVCK